MNLIDRLEGFSARRVALATVALWAVAEAIVLPVVPDVGVGLLAIAVPQRAWRLFAAVVAGAVIGSVVLTALVVATPDGVRVMLLSLPGIDATMLARVDADVAAEGVGAFAQVGPGPPLKVFTDAWVSHGGDFGGEVVGTILSRITRIGPVVIGAAIAGVVLASWIRHHDRLTVSAYAAAWIVFYGILSRLSSRISPYHGWRGE